MNHKRFVFLALIFLFFGVVIASVAGSMTTFGRGISIQDVSPASIDQPTPLFWYAQTFGETNVPYLADADHLYLPNGVGLDSTGNLWITEAMGSRAMKFNANGTFVMSIGVAGVVETADETHLASPSDTAVDSNGNIWVADHDAARVARYSPTGDYLMQLGVTWETGTDNAHFDRPVGVALDSAGNLYVSDINNHRIQIFDQNAYYSVTLGVTGVSGSDNDHFNYPVRITIDNADHLYVSDAQNHRVQIFDASHNYVATLGVSGVSGSDNDHFDIPRGVAVDASFIYVADGGNHRVQIFNRATHAYVDTLGSWGSGDYEFDLSTDVAVDYAGNLYVADARNHRVQMFNSSLTYVRTFGVTGVPYLTDGYHYNLPYNVAVDTSGNMAIVEDWGRGQRLIKLSAGGAPLFTIGEPEVSGADNEHFADPKGVAFDADGRIFVADCGNYRVQIFDSDGMWIARLGTGWGTGEYEFACPAGVALDDNGNIYVADGQNHRIQIYDSSRVYMATLGETGVSGSDNDHFNWPMDVAVDADGNIYVADLFNHRVQKFDSSLVWQMTLGETSVCGYDTSHFCEPYGVALDASGGLYVVDKFSPRVRVFDSSGVYRTSFGEWGIQVGQFRYPSGIDVDVDGNVYVADLYNHRIQKFVPAVQVFLPVVKR